MARMYPNPIDPETKSNAERRLYAAFRDSLDDTWTVFHSVAWQGLGRDGRPRDGEADFVIAHPTQGILVLEVKGGRVQWGPECKQWQSVAASGEVYNIKNPFAQAMDSKYTLLRQLKAMTRENELINLGHAVAFPDIAVREPNLGPDKPRAIILDAMDMVNIKAALDRALAHWRGQVGPRQSAPSAAVMEALVTLLGRTWDLKPALWGELIQERGDFVRLTQQQYGILNTLSRQRRAAICGCAGSGKTLLAVEKASRLAREGFQVLLTCFNKALAADLRAAVRPHANLEVHHFHGLCRDLTRLAGIAVPGDTNDRYFDQALPQALMEAAGRLMVRYDAIVVDEGQDFQEEWWRPLQLLLRDPDHGILYIFFDDNQRIYVRRGAFPVQSEPYPLTINCRNTQLIHKQVLKFYIGGEVPTALGPVGRPIVVEQHAPGSTAAAVAATLKRLTVDDGIPSDEIIVLTPFSKDKSQLWGCTGPSAVPLTDNPRPRPGEVFRTTIQSFKGLERAVVVLAEVERWSGPNSRTDRLDKLLYVGCSRARSLLIVLLPTDAPASVRQMFA
ncbi:MAG: NERD domain-containing protein [Anaerolineae bacterium]